MHYDAVREDENCRKTCGTRKPIFAAATKYSIDKGWGGEIGVVQRGCRQAVGGV